MVRTGKPGVLQSIPWGHKESDTTEWKNNNKEGVSMLLSVSPINVPMKPPLHGSQSCLGKEPCITQQSYKSCHEGPHKKMGHSEMFWKKCSPLEEERATHSSMIAWRTPGTVWKGKKIWHWKISLPSQKMCNKLLGKSGGQLLIAPERTKQLGQSRNDTQCGYVWWCK